jgi:nucleotide-binding universal stress UspA family protein
VNLVKKNDQKESAKDCDDDTEDIAMGARWRRKSGSVLLALTDGDHPTAALTQSAALARSLQAALHVIQVLPREYNFLDFEPQLDVVQATRRVERCLAAARGTKTWCDEVLPEPLSAKHLRIRIGDFMDEACARAAELDAALIILAPSTGQLGAAATALATLSSRPVLVARTFGARAALLAATDLQDDKYRVIQNAAELGALIEAPVVAVHNVSCMPVAFRTPSRSLAGDLPSSRLTLAAQRLQSPLHIVVANEVDPVDGILDQTRAHRAQTIVVGTRPRTPLERRTQPSVAAEVVDRSDRSVLVIPLSASSSQLFSHHFP